MSWTLDVALYGALTGTIASAVGIANRRDALWGRRARARELRPNLETLREVLAEAKASIERTSSLTGSRQFQARVQEIGEAVDRCPDRKTRSLLREVNVRCMTVGTFASASSGAPVSWALTSAIDSALAAIATVLGRLEHIDRKAPS